MNHIENCYWIRGVDITYEEKRGYTLQFKTKQVSFHDCFSVLYGNKRLVNF
jgi:hypothetical protein